MIDPIEELTRRNSLSSPDDVSAFEAAIDALPAELSLPDLRRMLLILNDGADDYTVMYDLLHRIEDTPMGDEERAFVDVLPTMLGTSPWWTETVVMRLLNNEVSKARLLAALHDGEPTSRVAALDLLARVSASEEPVARKAEELLASLR